MICVALLNGTYTIRIESVIRMYMWIIRIRIQPKCHRSCVDKNGFDVSNVLTPSLSLYLSLSHSIGTATKMHTLWMYTHWGLELSFSSEKRILCNPFRCFLWSRRNSEKICFLIDL